MRKIKKTGLFIILIMLLALVFCQTALAENTDLDPYKRALEQSGAGDINSILPSDVGDTLSGLGADLNNPEGLFNISKTGIITTLLEIFRNGFFEPFKTTLVIIGVLLIFASLGGILEEKQNGMALFVCFVASVISAAPIFSIMQSVKEAIRSLCNFMLSLVPVYGGVLLSSGRVSASSGFAALLLSAAEVISYLISYLFVPLSGAVICLSLCGGLSPVPICIRLAEWIKKSANWAMGIATTLFLGVLSIQNSFLNSSDGLGLKASKVVLGSSIPIMGPAIAETVGAVKSCLNLLSGAVGIYAVLAIALLALPIITELFLWRVSMWVCSGVAEIFGMPQMEKILKSIDFGLSVLLSATLFTSLLFIVAIAITIKG